MRGAKAEIEPHDEPLPDDLPAPPEWMSDEGREEWLRVLPVLYCERRTLAQVDLGVFAVYCEAYGTVVQATRQIREEGLTFKGPSGLKRNPAIGIRDAAANQVRQMAAELGLTPASRGRPGIKPGGGDGDEPGLFGLFGGHGL